MTERNGEPPACFGDLEVVFPKGADGLRHSPGHCMACPEKTGCLRQAIHGQGGTRVREEAVDRAYEAGVIGFFDRWARKKALYVKRKKEKSIQTNGESS